MNQRTILFLTPRMGIGGAQRYVIEKAKWLKENNYNVIVCSEEGIWTKKLNDAGIRHISLEWINDNPYLLDYEIFIQRLMLINEIIEREGVDIIEANQLFPAIYTYNLVKINHLPMILNTLSELSFLDSRNIRFLLEMQKLGLYFNLGKESNAVIENCNKVILDKCINIPIPIALQNVKLVRGSYILTVARFSEEKRYIEYLMKGYVNFMNAHHINGFNLVVVGDGKLYKKYKKISDRLNKSIKSDSKIVLVGNKVDEDLEELYKNCDIYVGMGTTLLSAASYYKPSIIATFPPHDIKKAYGYFGSISGNTSFGQVTDDMQIESYEYFLEELYYNSDIYTKTAQEGYELVKNNYDIDKVMTEWIKIYENLMGKKIKYSPDKVVYEPKRMNVLRILYEIAYFLKKVRNRNE